MNALFLEEERLVHSFDLLWSKGSKVGIGWDDLLGESDIFNGSITGDFTHDPVWDWVHVGILIGEVT